MPLSNPNTWVPIESVLQMKETAVSTAVKTASILRLQYVTQVITRLKLQISATHIEINDILKTTR